MKYPVVLKALMSIILIVITGACVPGDNENTVPIANSQTVSTLPNTAVAVTLTGSDSDGDTLIYAVTGNPSHGTLSGSAPDLTYIPDIGYSGSDNFTFTVSDGEKTSSSATIAVTIKSDADKTVTLSLQAHSQNSLMAIGQVNVSEDASALIEYTSASTTTLRTSESTSATSHTITMIGMRAQTIYTMTAVATFSDGSEVRSDAVEFTTGALPDTPPTVSVTTSTDNSAGGITFFGSGVKPAESSRYWGFDEAGYVVWYLHGEYSPASSPVIRVVEPGVLLIFLNNSIRTITTEGETIAEYTLGRYHHEALLLPNGNTMMLANETMVNDDGDTLTGDKIIEKDASDTTVWEWSSFEHLDTTRFPGSLSQIEKNSGLDWTHSNALFYIEDENTILLSVRSQSWVVKIDRYSGNILWIMGDSAGTDASYQYNDKFMSLTAGTWMANQHAPMISDAGEVLIYDNRNESGGADDMSRVVKFSINEPSMTATQTWEAISPKYTSSLGDVDELSNGNIMMCSGGPGSESQAYIVEVTPDASAETVWQMSIATSVYRAERMSWESFLNISDTNTEFPPVADFSADSTTISESSSVAFTDLTTNSPTTWSWTFEGGTPSSSTTKSPVVSYSSPGVYSVTLSATNAAGSDTALKSGYITVTLSSTIDYVVVDTGQNVCFDDSGAEISCPMAGEDFYGQDAQHAGTTPDYTSSGNGTVTDNKTGLMWQQDPGDKVTFAEAVSGAATLSLGGYTDWRFPTIKELYSLMNFNGQTGEQSSDVLDDSWIPFIDTTFFIQAFGDPDAGERLIDGQTWSATEYVSTTMNSDETVFGVNFIDGRIKGYPKYSPAGGTERKMFARYVRGTSSVGINHFVNNGDGTVTDQATGLMWQQADAGPFNWGEALNYAETLTIAGYSDWRLPNAKELQSIVDYSRSPDTTNSPAIDPVFSTTLLTWTSDCNGEVLSNYPHFWASTTHLEATPVGNAGKKGVYIAFGEALGYMNNQWMDVHGAGAQRSDPKSGDPDSGNYACGFGPQGDYIGINNYVRLVRDVN